MRLIHDDVLIIIVREPGQPLFLRQGLYRTDCHREIASETGGLRFFQCGIQPGRFFQFVSSLIQQFPAVRHDQHPVTLVNLVFCDRGKHDRLAAARRQDKERLTVPLVPCGQNCLFRLGLIRPEFKHRRLLSQTAALQQLRQTSCPLWGNTFHHNHRNDLLRSPGARCRPGPYTGGV